MTNKRDYICPYCGGKSRQPTICDTCVAKRRIIRKSGIWSKGGESDV